MIPYSLKLSKRKAGGYNIGSAGLYTKSGKLIKDRDSLLCGDCELLLRDPQQLLVCGTRICRTCLEERLKQLAPVCPKHGEPLLSHEIRTDKGCDHELQTLLVDCPGYDNGCKWRNSLTLLEIHIEDCEYISIICEYNCGSVMARKQWPLHKTECSNRPVPCQYCHQPIAQDEKDHPDICDLYPLECEVCSQKIPRRMVKLHQLYECPEVEVDCSMEECTYKAKLAVMPSHYSGHLHQLSCLLKSTAAMVIELMEEKALLKDSMSVIEKKMAIMEDSLTVMKTKNESLNSLVCSLMTDKQQGLCIETDSALPKPLKKLDTIHSWNECSISANDASTNIISNDWIHKIKTIEKDVSMMKPQLEQLKGEVSQQKLKVVGCIDNVEVLQESVTRHSVTLEEVKLRQDVQDVKTTNGVFIWKIPEIGRRYKDAIERRTLSLYSPPFFSSPHGYRMCIRTYLNGDGSGKATHISIFFVLMKSEHDNLLKWPFRRPVTFQLLNQENPERSIGETFMPDEHSPSFQQPKSEMNIASGFPKFASQSVLKAGTGFTKGDAIFIRCKVDVSGLTGAE